MPNWEPLLSLTALLIACSSPLYTSLLFSPLYPPMPCILLFWWLGLRTFTEFTLNRILFFGFENCVLSQWYCWESLNELGTLFLKNISQRCLSWPNKMVWLIGMSNFSKTPETVVDGCVSTVSFQCTVRFLREQLTTSRKIEHTPNNWNWTKLNKKDLEKLHHMMIKGTIQSTWSCNDFKLDTPNISMRCVNKNW